MNSICVLYYSAITATYLKVACLKSHSVLPKFPEIIWKGESKASCGGWWEMVTRLMASDSLSSHQKWLALRNRNTWCNTASPVWTVLCSRHWPNVLILEIRDAFSCQSSYWNGEYSLDQFQDKYSKSDWLLLSKFLMKENIHILKSDFKKEVLKIYLYCEI